MSPFLHGLLGRPTVCVHITVELLWVCLLLHRSSASSCLVHFVKLFGARRVRRLHISLIVRAYSHCSYSGAVPVTRLSHTCAAAGLSSAATGACLQDIACELSRVNISVGRASSFHLGSTFQTVLG